MSSPESFTLTDDVNQCSPDVTLYFHYPCFDGLVSCVLTANLLLKRNRWNEVRFCPVNYDDRKNWLSKPVDQPCAVVDFLYHPKASFWADHHVTTFLNDELRADFERRQGNSCLLFDTHAPSCASILWKEFSSFFDDRFAEMVNWANKIDSASYTSVGEAIFGEAPALRINSSLMLRNGMDYCRLLVRELSSKDLDRVAELPEIRERYAEVRSRREAGLKRMEDRVHLEEGNIVAFDIQANENDIVSRYAPYYFFERARYSIGSIRMGDSFRVTAMRNPWLDFESIPLGRIFEQFGGGGHQRVASVIIPVEQSRRVHEIVEHVKHEIRSQSVVERVLA
jgi:hypothetical protein